MLVWYGALSVAETNPRQVVTPETGQRMNRFRRDSWVVSSIFTTLPCQFCNSYPKCSRLELQRCYPIVSVGQESGYSCAGPPAQHPKVLYPEVLWGGTWLSVGFHPLKVVDWRSPSVPGHMGLLHGAVHIIWVSEWVNQGKEEGRDDRGRWQGEREWSQQYRSFSLLRPNLAFADSATSWPSCLKCWLWAPSGGQPLLWAAGPLRSGLRGPCCSGFLSMQTSCSYRSYGLVERGNRKFICNRIVN